MDHVCLTLVDMDVMYKLTSNCGTSPLIHIWMAPELQAQLPLAVSDGIIKAGSQYMLK